MIKSLSFGTKHHSFQHFILFSFNWFILFFTEIYFKINEISESVKEDDAIIRESDNNQSGIICIS